MTCKHNFTNSYATILIDLSLQRQSTNYFRLTRSYITVMRFSFSSQLVCGTTGGIMCIRGRSYSFFLAMSQLPLPLCKLLAIVQQNSHLLICCYAHPPLTQRETAPARDRHHYKAQGTLGDLFPKIKILGVSRRLGCCPGPVDATMQPDHDGKEVEEVVRFFVRFKHSTSFRTRVIITGTTVVAKSNMTLHGTLAGWPECREDHVKRKPDVCSADELFRR